MLWLARKQSIRGHNVKVFSTGPITTEIEMDGFSVRLERPPMGAILPGILKDLHLLKVARRSPDISSADVFHIHSVPEGALLAQGVRGACVLSYDHFAFRQGHRTPLFRITRKLLRRYDELLPVSSAIRSASAEYWRIPLESMEVVPNGVDLALFREDLRNAKTYREQLGIATDEIVLLWFGRVNRVKGIDLLTKAYQALKTEFTNLRLLVVGPADTFGSSHENEYTRMITMAGGIYRRAVSETEAPVVLSAADVFVYPSRNEPFGMAAVEAMACGRAVLCSDTSGLGAIAREAGAGLFECGSLHDLTLQLRRFVSDPEYRAEVALRGRSYAAHFEWGAINEKLESLYEKAIQLKTRRRGVS